MVLATDADPRGTWSASPSRRLTTNEVTTASVTESRSVVSRAYQELLVAIEVAAIRQQRVRRQSPLHVEVIQVGADGSRNRHAAHSLRRRADSSRGKRSSRWRSMAAPMRPANRGCGRVGRDRNSGWAWVDDVVGVRLLRQLDELHQIVVRRRPREDQTGFLQLIPIRVVDLVTVTMALLDLSHAVRRADYRALVKFGGI